MMEVEIEDAAVISADSTAASRLLDQQPFHFLLATRHGFAEASLATPSQSTTFAVGISAELRQPVVLADPDLNRALAPRVRRPASFADQRNGGRRVTRRHEHMFPYGQDVCP